MQTFQLVLQTYAIYFVLAAVAVLFGVWWINRKRARPGSLEQLRRELKIERDPDEPSKLNLTASGKIGKILSELSESPEAQEYAKAKASLVSKFERRGPYRMEQIQPQDDQPSAWSPQVAFGRCLYCGRVAPTHLETCPHCGAAQS